MKTSHHAALVLAALATVGALSATPAGASPATAAVLDPACATNAAVQVSTLVLADGVAEWTVSARPGCEGTVVSLAAHHTLSDRWDPAETQLLIGSNSMVLTDVPTMFRLRIPPCQVQVDAVVGDPLPQVDGTHRYNETAIGGTVNRLVDVDYAPADCPAPTTSAPAPTTTTPVEQVEIGTPNRVTVDEPLTPAPTTTTVVEAVPTLPQTGGPQGFLAWVGLAVLAAGGFLVGVTRRR